MNRQQFRINSSIREKGVTLEKTASVVSRDDAQPPQILLMEDDASVTRGLQLILEEEGYGVELASTGRGALSAVKRKTFDILVADLRLPDMDGMEVIREVKKQCPETEVMVTTGYPSVTSAVESIKRGAVEYLPKPFTEEEFIETLERVLERRKEARRREISEAVRTSTEEGPLEKADTADLPSTRPRVLVVEDRRRHGAGTSHGPPRRRLRSGLGGDRTGGHGCPQ